MQLAETMLKERGVLRVHGLQHIVELLLHRVLKKTRLSLYHPLSFSRVSSKLGGAL